MRIAQLTPNWHPTGGTASYVRLLSARLADAGHEVLVVHQDVDRPLSEPRAHLTVRSIPDAFLDTAPDGARAPDRAVSAALADFRPDVLHFHGTNNFPLEADLRRRYPATKTLHVYEYCPSGTKFHRALGRACTFATGPFCVPRQGYLRCTSSKRPAVWWRQYRHAAAANLHNPGFSTLIVASAFVKREAERTGFDGAQIAVLPYFVELPTVPPTATAPVVLFAGRITQEKGVDAFVAAFAALDASARAVIVGDGADLPRVRDLVTARGLADRVEFTGWLTGAALDAAYARAAVVVVPSLWPEPFGLVGLEAMARARPVVAFGVGGIPEWLDDGVTGWMVAPGDARALAERIQWTLAHPIDAAAMGARGRARAARDFTAETHLARLLPIYRSGGTRA